MLFGETKDSGLIPLTTNALYNSIGEHRALKYVKYLIKFFSSNKSLRLVF